MKILKFQNGDNLDQTLASVLDAALKEGGFQMLSKVNLLLSSLREEEEEKKSDCESKEGA